MAKKIIRTGTTADPTGDSLKNAFVKVNDNFTELYNALGLDADTLNIGAFEFAGSVMTTTDSSAIVIDQATTITSNLTVGGDLLPSVANGGDLGSSTLPWRSLYVSNNTIYIGGTAVGLDANGNLTTGGTVVGSTPAWANITGKPTFAAVATSGAYADLTGKPTIPTDFRGSVFADDSTLMIDAVDNKIYATELTVAVGNFVNVNSNNVDVENINGLSSQINFTVGGNNNLVIENNLVTIQNVSLSVAGDITLGGNIRSEGNINIDINLGDSTLRRWQFGEDGDLTFPEGAVVKTTSGHLTIKGQEYVYIDSATNGQINIGTSSGIGAVVLGSKSRGTNVIVGDLQVENGVYEFFSSLADATGVVTHNCANGHIFYHTSPDANWTVNLTNLLDTWFRATSVTLIIAQGATGYYPSAVQIAGVAQTIKWQGNVTPTPSINRTDVVTFSIINVSGTYTVLGQLTGF